MDMPVGIDEEPEDGVLTVLLAAVQVTPADAGGLDLSPENFSREVCTPRVSLGAVDTSP